MSKGKVYLVHREFPLPMHQYARPAACLATAAARMNRYEEVCAVLFRTQESWSKTGKIDEALRGALSPSELRKIVALASDPQVMAQVQKDVDLGVRANVRSTPTLMVVHKQRTYPIASAVSYPIFKRFLDDLLSK
ncbi:MAG: DsbA family protein [Bryobacteraceae bacterium]